LKNSINSKIKILIKILVVEILLISEWWILRNQKQASTEKFCTINILEDCYGKKVKVVGTFEVLSKGCNAGIVVSPEKGETISTPLCIDLVIWYLISCLIIFVWNKLNAKKQQWQNRLRHIRFTIFS